MELIKRSIGVMKNASRTTYAYLPGSKFIRLPCNSMHGSIWSVWFHTITCMEPWPTDLPCNSTHGIIWFHTWKGMERKARIRNSQNFKFSFNLGATFWKQQENNWIWFDLNWKTKNDTIKPKIRSASKLVGIRTWVFSFLNYSTDNSIHSQFVWGIKASLVYKFGCNKMFIQGSYSKL